MPVCKLKREDCWMSFSEALASYLQAREEANETTAAGLWATCRMQDAEAHMNALTASNELFLRGERNDA